MSSYTPAHANFSLPGRSKNTYGLEVVLFSSVCLTVSVLLKREKRNLVFKKGVVPVVLASERKAQPGVKAAGLRHES